MSRSKRLSTEVLAVLSDLEIDGSNVRIAQQLDRPMYVAVNDALEAIGGKWNRKAKAHVFGEDPRERIDLAILSGEVERPKDFDYFPTPAPLAKQLAEMAGLKPYEQVLEPSAGQGALINAILDDSPLVGVMAIELLEANVKVLQAKHGNDPTVRICCGDFLKTDPCDRHMRCVMNPPFSKRQDIAHVMRAFDWLAPGGRLVSVMSAGVLFRQDRLTTTFRGFVEENGGTIEPLPEGSFKESGTSVNTVVIVVDKP